jgi:hypothetical protein
MERNTEAIVMTPRELFSLTLLAATFCTAIGIGLGVMTILLIERGHTATERAYIKGTMVAISASKVRCESWRVKPNKVVCE